MSVLGLAFVVGFDFDWVLMKMNEPRVVFVLVRGGGGGDSCCGAAAADEYDAFAAVAPCQ